MTSSASVDSTTPADAQLVAGALSGETDAFETIVRRYQRLVCSVAFAAVGNVGASEDLAQETFLAAWKGLPELREPEKLRGWLCGIARRLSLNSRRRLANEPSLTASPLESDSAELAGPAESPADAAAKQDDAELVWRALSSLPETYREVLVLYYREQRSVQAVACALDLSEDAVKQRLARGRDHLRAEVSSLVERSLVLSGPGAGFVPAVMAALPVSAASAKAAAGGSVLAKSLASFSVLGGMGAGVTAGLAGAYLGYKQSEKAARSDEERALARRMFHTHAAGMAALLLSIGGFIVLNRRSAIPGWLELTLVPSVAIAYFCVIGVATLRTYRTVSALRRSGIPIGEAPATEIRSPWELWGRPLFHARFGGSLAEGYRPVRAWIAFGNIAYGRLVAYGGIAVAPVAIGGVAIGGLAVGGVALGAAALGGSALGGFAVGGQAVGWLAVAGCAIAYKGAYGGLAIARHFAVAPTARAVHADDPAAIAFFHDGVLGSVCRQLPYAGWIGVIGFVPVIVWWTGLRRRAQGHR